MHYDKKTETEQPCILLVYCDLIPSVILCAQMPLQHLGLHGSIRFRQKKNDQVCQADLQWADLIVLVRADSLLEEWIARACARAGKKILYILDDDLLHVPSHFSSGRHYAREHVRRRICKIMEYSDYLASPSPVLLERYGARFADRFLLIEPASLCMDEKKKQPDGKIHIGFAGSVDRGGDIDTILTDALCTIRDRYQDKVEFAFFGVDTEVAKKLNGRVYPYTESYQAYQEKMLELNWDIGLAPMPDSSFHACKHYNKLIEYSGMGIAGVYSDVVPYCKIVRHGENGMLCNNTAEAWVHALSELIENDALRKKIAANCLAEAKHRFSVGNAAEQMEHIIRTMPLKQSKRSVVGFLFFARMMTHLERLLDLTCQYKWKTPLVVADKIRNRIGGHPAG